MFIALFFTYSFVWPERGPSLPVNSNLDIGSLYTKNYPKDVGRNLKDGREIEYFPGVPVNRPYPKEVRGDSRLLRLLCSVGLQDDSDPEPCMVSPMAIYVNREIGFWINVRVTWSPWFSTRTGFFSGPTNSDLVGVWDQTGRYSTHTTKPLPISD